MRIFNPIKIRERRRSLKLTQAELAQKACTARVYIIELEQGRKIPKATMIAKIAYALRVKESYFFADNGSKSLQ